MPKRGPGLPSEDHVNRRFGERLRFCRERAGKSQSDVGNALGVSFQQIQKYENGTTSISLNRIFDFAANIGITMSSLFEGLDARHLTGHAGGFAEERQAALTDDEDDDMKVGAGPNSKLKVQLLNSFNRITDAKARRTLIEMAEVLAKRTDSDAAA
jgi:transcriptional regulator with XRE-family HTH domain